LFKDHSVDVTAADVCKDYIDVLFTVVIASFGSW